MIFLETSVWLRVLLDQPQKWRGWDHMKRFFMSELLSVETLRVLDRLLVTRGYTSAEVIAANEKLRQLEARSERLLLSRTVVSRASLPMPSPIKTLDAFHLASAMIVREKTNIALTFATHDEQLATAAELFGFAVVGVV